MVEARRDLVVAPSVTYSIPGTRAPLGSTLADGCTIASGVDPSAYPVGTTLHLGFAPGTIGDFPSSATGVQWVSAIVGNHGVLKHEVQNLTALTQYIAGLSPTGTLGDWIGNPIAFRTMADPTSITESVTISWALGSCQYWWVNNPPTSGTKFEYAWQDILSNPVDILWDVGDFHYQGGSSSSYGDPTEWQTWAAMYWAQMPNLPVMMQARALMIEDQISDDHEFSSNNGESALPVPPGEDDKQGLHRQTQMEASQNIFALPDTEDTSGRGMYYTYLLTPHVRVIVVDGESLDRSWGAYADSNINPKTFLGSPQTNWLKAILTTKIVPLNLIISGKAWIADDIADPPLPEDTDKIWAYPYWRSGFYQWLQQWNETEGNPQVNIVWMAGDRHFVAYDDGTNNSWGGFPCVVGSGWCEKPLERRTGENYIHWYPQGNFPPVSPDTVFQYARGAIVDDPVSRTVTLSVTLMINVLNTDSMTAFASASKTWSY